MNFFLLLRLSFVLRHSMSSGLFRLRLRGLYLERSNRFLKLEILTLVGALEGEEEVIGQRKFLLGDYLRPSLMMHFVNILKLMVQ